MVVKTRLEVKMRTQLRPAIVAIVLFTLLTGAIYPMIVTGIAQAAFPHQANGSLVLQGNIVQGSSLIGQYFNDPRYFWGRPSATGRLPYDAAASSGSNLGPTNPILVETVRARIVAFKAADPLNVSAIPVDLVTASGSGLDPHISVAAAIYQAPRVAKARGMSEETVRNLLEQHIQSRQLGILGEPRVNVLELNIALDGLK